MSYYPPQGSQYAQPVAYTTSHRSHRSRHGNDYETYPAQYANGYYAGQPMSYAGTTQNPVVIVPSSSRHSRRSRSRSRSRSRHGHGHRHHRHHSSVPQVVTTAGTGVAYTNSSYGHHSYPRHHHSSGYSTSGLTFTERLRRFFGLAPRSVEGVKYKHQGRYSSWGFLGRSKRRRYVDARTGAEVDKRGRPVYRV